MNFYKVSAGRSRFLDFWNKAVETFPEERYYCSVHVPHPSPNESAGFRLADDTLLDPNVSLFVEICSSNKAILEPLVKLDHLTDLCVVSFNRSTPQVMTLDMVQKCCQMDDENIFYDALLDSTVDGTFFPFEEPLFQKLDEMLGFYWSIRSKVCKVWTDAGGLMDFTFQKRDPKLSFGHFKTQDLSQIVDNCSVDYMIVSALEILQKRITFLPYLLVIQGQQSFVLKMLELNEQAIKEVNVEKLIAGCEDAMLARRIFVSTDGTTSNLKGRTLVKVDDKEVEKPAKEAAKSDYKE